MKLRVLIQEARRLVEYEGYVNREGWATDDDGNEWYAGPEYAGTFGLHDAPPDNSPRDGGGGGYRKSFTKSMTADAAKARGAFLDDLLALKPNNFLSSIRSQMASKGSLSPKQDETLDKILKGMLDAEGLALWKEAGQGRYEKGSARPRGPAPKVVTPAPMKPSAATGSGGQDDMAGTLRKALQRKSDSFLADVLKSLESDKDWKAGASVDTLKKIRHELYKRSMKKEADLFRQ